MDNDSPPDPPADFSAFTDDPEIAALLDFEPVPHKYPRQHGWNADNQRIYVVQLALTGDVERAADAVALTGNGVRQLRRRIGAAQFAEAWDKALALHKARKRRGARPVPAHDRGARDVGGDETLTVRQEKEVLQQLDLLFEQYWKKLADERKCRLEGRIVEADFCVRQLTWLEVLLDLGGRGEALVEALRIGEWDLINVTATPMSVLLDSVRRDFWRRWDEPERPPLAPLGEHEHGIATGEPLAYRGGRDGRLRDWERRQKRRQAGNAEAQAAWEEKARAEAEAWRTRVEGEAAGGAPKSPSPPEAPAEP